MCFECKMYLHPLTTYRYMETRHACITGVTLIDKITDYVIGAEWQHCLEHPMEGISFGPFAENIFYWEAIIEGPAGTPYEGGIFMLDVAFPMEYPFKPPKVQFRTRVFHPNISQEGFINLRIFRDIWGPSLTIAKVLLCVRSLLVDGINPDDPLEPHIAHLYKTDRMKYEETVREWTKKYAM